MAADSSPATDPHLQLDLADLEDLAVESLPQATTPPAAPAGLIEPLQGFFVSIGETPMVHRWDEASRAVTCSLPLSPEALDRLLDQAGSGRLAAAEVPGVGIVLEFRPEHATANARVLRGVPGYPGRVRHQLGNVLFQFTTDRDFWLPAGTAVKLVFPMTDHIATLAAEVAFGKLTPQGRVLYVLRHRPTAANAKTTSIYRQAA